MHSKYSLLGPILLGVFASLNLAAMTVTLTPSVRSPAPLGTLVTWTASVPDADPGTLSYAFQVRPALGAFHTVVDYGPKSSLSWTTIQREGAYEMQVSVRNASTGEVASTSSTFQFSSLVTNGQPVVTQAANPLVLIYSAPACAAGSRMRVEFQSTGGTAQATPWHSCAPGHSMNFYLAGLQSDVPYQAHHTLDSGTSISTGPTVALRTSPVQLGIGNVTVLTSGPVPTVDGVLLQSVVGGTSVATDLSGNVLWSAPSDISFITRPQTGGTFLAIFEDLTQDPSYQFFREFDLAGVTQVETNAARVSEQLTAMGMHSINSFHHEARKLAAGGYLVMASSERILTDVQGAGPVDVIGDTIIVLNDNLQVVWAWDAFDHLDNTRQAVLGETCNLTNAGCPPIYLAPVANDWLHGNSLQLTPDGNILYSSRHQDWLIKIDYENGTGSGAILWRLGNQGDFQIVSSDPYPWFSHQHDANFEADKTSLTVFDDGNTRVASDPNGHSRGQALSIDEANRVATVVLNADVGSYSSAVGSAQKLPNGDYHFDSGFIEDSQGNLSAQSIEMTAAGTIVYGIGVTSLEYRTFRMRDLYTAP